MANNIRFRYLYRDSGNYKTFGFEDFSNPHNLSLEQIQTKFIESCLAGSSFIPKNPALINLIFTGIVTIIHGMNLKNQKLLKENLHKKQLTNLLRD